MVTRRGREKLILKAFVKTSCYSFNELSVEYYENGKSYDLLQDSMMIAISQNISLRDSRILLNKTFGESPLRQLQKAIETKHKGGYQW